MLHHVLLILLLLLADSVKHALLILLELIDQVKIWIVGSLCSAGGIL